FLPEWTFKWIFGTRLHCHSFLSFCYGRGRVAQPGIGDTEIRMQFRRCSSIRRCFSNFSLEFLGRALVSGFCAVHVAPALLSQAKCKKEFLLLVWLIIQCFGQNFCSF